MAVLTWASGARPASLWWRPNSWPNSPHTGSAVATETMTMQLTHCGPWGSTCWRTRFPWQDRRAVEPVAQHDRQFVGYFRGSLSVILGVWAPDPCSCNSKQVIPSHVFQCLVAQFMVVWLYPLWSSQVPSCCFYSETPLRSNPVITVTSPLQYPRCQRFLTLGSQ